MTSVDVNFDDGLEDRRHFTLRLVVSIIRGSIFVPIISLPTPSDGASDEICQAGRIIEVCNTRPSLERAVRDHKVSHPQSISFPG